MAFSCSSGSTIRLAVMLAAIGLTLAETGIAADRKRPLESFTGTIMDALHRPASTVAVMLQSGDGRAITHSTTDEHGHFRMSESLVGNYALVTQKRGFKSATKFIVLPLRAGERLEIVLESEAALNLPVNASRIVQNGLSLSGTNRYT